MDKIELVTTIWVDPLWLCKRPRWRWQFGKKLKQRLVIVLFGETNQNAIQIANQYKSALWFTTNVPTPFSPIFGLLCVFSNFLPQLYPLRLISVVYQNFVHFPRHKIRVGIFCPRFQRLPFAFDHVKLAFLHADKRQKWKNIYSDSVRESIAMGDLRDERW